MAKLEHEHENLLNVCAELDEKFMLKSDAQAELTDANFKHLLDVTAGITPVWVITAMMPDTQGSSNIAAWIVIVGRTDATHV